MPGAAYIAGDAGSAAGGLGRGRGGGLAGLLVGGLSGRVGILRVGRAVLKGASGRYERERVLLGHIVPGILHAQSLSLEQGLVCAPVNSCRDA